MAKRKGKMLTMRVSDALAARIEKLARIQRVPVSHVVRETLERAIEREERVYTMTIYERLKPWIGSLDSSKTAKGPVTSADASGQARRMVLEKWRRRGSKRTS